MDLLLTAQGETEGGEGEAARLNRLGVGRSSFFYRPVGVRTEREGALMVVKRPCKNALIWG